MDKKVFADWLTHLGVCTGRPVDRAVLTSYYLELKEQLTEDELAEAVRLLAATWTDIGFPKVWHLLNAARKTKARRARKAVRLVRQLDLDGYDLTSPTVRGYVAWRVREDSGDTDSGRAIMALPIAELLAGSEDEAVEKVRDALGWRRLPAIPEARQLADPRVKVLVDQIGNPDARVQAKTPE